MKKIINLNPVVLESKKKNIELEIFLLAIVIFGILISAFTIYKSVELYNLKNKEQTIQNQVSSLQTGSLNTNLQNRLNKINSKIDELQNLNSKYNVYDNINEISSYINNDIKITEIVFLNGNFKIEGIAKSQTEIANFLSNLKSNKLYSNAQLVGVSSKNKDEVNLVKNNDSEKNKKNNIKDNKSVKNNKSNEIQFSIEVGGNVNG